MKILIIGKRGQVGFELERSFHGVGEVIAVDRTQVDLANLDAVRQIVRAVKPNLLINAAAYTSVDDAEESPGLAMRVNAEAPAVMAREAKALGAAMIQYSTDYVFDGHKTSPYIEDDLPCPINIYGHTKLAGERAVQSAGIPHLILRTSWIYGMRGRNFLKTVVRLARERNALRIVADQRGTPTWCRTVAQTTASIVKQSLTAKNSSIWWDEQTGVYHLSARGETTWYGFANAILANSSLAANPVVIPIASSDYSSNANRPLYTVMSSERLRHAFCDLPEWEAALRRCQEQLEDFEP